MAAPVPPCAVSPNARYSVRAGGATAADARPMATSNGAERRRDGAASRSRVRCDRRREARGDGGASAGLRRRHDRPALGTCGGGGRLERDDCGGEAVRARTSCSRLERARMREAGERGRPGRALGPSRVAQHAQSADPLGGSALTSGKGGVSEGARTSASTCPPRTSASGNEAPVATVEDAPSRTSGLLDDACRGDVRKVSRGGPRARGERAGLRARLAAAVLPAARAAVWASRTYRAGRRPGRAGGERRGPFGKSNASWVWGVG